jgi:spermidine/putrescine-binding protein
MTFRSIFARLLLTLSATFSLTAQAQQPIISVLCPYGLLDYKILSNFERSAKVRLRVELASGQREIEQRIKNSINNWDVVVADESQLAALTHGRLIRPLKEDRFQEKNPNALSRPTKLMEMSRTWIPLAVDPLGVSWIKSTLEPQTTPTWASLIDPSITPFWRGRLFLTPDLSLLGRIALMTQGIPESQALPGATAPALQWLQKAKLQQRSGQNQLVLDLLSERVVAGPLWKSDYLRVRKTVQNLEFAVPPSGTFFRRFGVALVSDTLREELATNFIAHLIEKRDDLARYAGLLPLSGNPERNTDVTKWVVFDDSTPLNRELEVEVKKIFTK